MGCHSEAGLIESAVSPRLRTTRPTRSVPPSARALRNPARLGVLRRRPGKDSAREIREYFIPDISNWKKHNSYGEGFNRLIADLKSSDSKIK
jgi:hypothetical protein